MSMENCRDLRVSRNVVKLLPELKVYIGFERLAIVQVWWIHVIVRAPVGLQVLILRFSSSRATADAIESIWAGSLLYIYV